MTEVECVTRRWGNSLGIVIPREIIEQEHIDENEKITLSFSKKRKAEEFFGLCAGWTTSTDEIKKEMKKGW